MGDINVKVVKGTNLAVRDIRSSDPYVVLYLGQQVCFYISYVHFIAATIAGLVSNMS